ncbi:MAG: aminomethyltransferase family protein [Granulosicoccus sp.]|nr:aminomethyltransferase family protein [Granulosicoccus sp.]
MAMLTMQGFLPQFKTDINMAVNPDSTSLADTSADTPVKRPEPEWLYQPPRNGFDSASRTYKGFSLDQRKRTIRPACPVKLNAQAGDLISLNNDDGATPVCLLSLNKSGEVDFSALGLSDNPRFPVGRTTTGYAAIVSWFENQGGRVGSLDTRVDDQSAALQAIRIFDQHTPSGEAFVIRVQRDVTLWLLIDPVHVYHADRVHLGSMGGSVSFDHVRVDVAASRLPEPFGDVREEFTISRGTAMSYEVKQGEVLQIIDVEGQQCSDFMAMNAHSLQDGMERYIDSTVTRSMIRGAYPMPGLFDKFYDQDMRPLLKLKQDTVGRHDTFALACTARGYEERGFFGHLNCSDNISHVYQRFGIKARSAWPAINFFFNSWIDHHDNRIQVDEAWSRPGDYVAMEAMTDLVAASTACPDDVDPINGWNPTDIHVRIYHKNTPVRYAVAYRAEPDSEAILTEHSAFHERTSSLTQQFQVARDVWLPQSYESTRSIEEYHACREAVTVQDMSSLRKFDILGPDAEALLQKALTRDITRLSVNRGVYALMCDSSGVVIDDGTLFRLTADTFRWCCGSDDSGLQLKELASAQGLNVWIKSLFSSLPNLAVQGPNSRELIDRIAFTQPTVSSVKQLRWFGSTIARLYDRDGEPFHLTRTGYTGELGYEIFCHPDSALPIWDALMQEGQALGITAMGLEALETIRIEAGLMAAGAEFAADVDAFEAGLGFAVDLNKADFVGKAALERNQLQPRRVLKGLKFAGHEAPVSGDPVMHGRRQVGVITSATVSPALDCAIAMARLAVEHATVGETLEAGKLERQGKRLTATVCDIPFVDPTRSRARA